MRPNVVIMKKIYLLLLMLIGLSHPFLYFASSSYRESQGQSMHSLRPFYTIATSPLPLVFDTQSFFSTIFIKLNFADSTNQTLEIDSDFIQDLPFSKHLKLHIARYSITGQLFKSEKIMASILCSADLYKNTDSRKKIMSFEISTYFNTKNKLTAETPITKISEVCPN